MQQFTFFNVMVALFLAHEVEEEDVELRLDLIRAAFGSSIVNQQSVRLFMRRKEKLWLAMNYNVIVKREESDSVMNRVLRDNYIWRRKRASHSLLSPSCGSYTRTLVAVQRSKPCFSISSGSE